MTIKELSQLYHLNREIEMDKRRLDELELLASSPKAQNLDGMPHAPGYGDALARCVAEIVDLKAIISAKQQQCIYERNRLERYISSIPDSLTRQIFTYRFVNGLSWWQVNPELQYYAVRTCVADNTEELEDLLRFLKRRKLTEADVSRYGGIVRL